MNNYVVGDTVHMVYMYRSGTVLQVILIGGEPCGYVVDVEDHGVDIFRADEVDDADTNNA